MKPPYAIAILLVSSCLMGGVSAQEAPVNLQQGQAQNINSMHWAKRVSLSVQMLQNFRPIARQVVLVPDTATFLDEITKWTPASRWPVLLEDDYYAPMFIRSFEPTVVFRRTSIGSLPKDVNDRKKLVSRAIGKSWLREGGTGETAEEIFRDMGFRPLGAIITSMKDPAWPAAAALAACRGLALLYLEDELGATGEILSKTRSKELLNRVNGMVNDLEIPWETVGDRLDFLTICRSMPARMDIDFDMQMPEGLPEQILNGPKAMTDVLGRQLDGTRWAFTGWIFGSKRSTIYVTMCSYFLSHRNVWLGDTYTHEDGRDLYSMNKTADLFKYQGYKVDFHPDLTLDNFRSLVAGGLTTDQIYFNTAGNADFFEVGADKASPLEVPLLNRPAFLYLIHSWSMKRPHDQETIGGRWLRNGAYAVYGSSHEPLLNSFRPAYEVARRIVSNLPLGFAVRLWEDEGPMSMPWRINLYGDPMMLSGNTQRRSEAPTNGYGAENVNETAQAALELAVKTPTDANFSDAIGLMVLINLDELATDLWNRAVEEGVAGALCAKAALGPLFRAKDEAGFINAWSKLDRSTSYERDMLWSLMGPSLGPNTDMQTASILEASIRGNYPLGDLQRLAPVLARLHGNAYVVQKIDGASRKAVNRREKRGLNELRRQFQ